MRILASVVGLVLAASAGMASAHGGNHGFRHGHGFDDDRYVLQRLCRLYAGFRDCRVLRALVQDIVDDERGANHFRRDFGRDFGRDTRRGRGNAQRGQGNARRGQGNVQRGQGNAQRGQRNAQRGQGNAQRGQRNAQRGQGNAQRGQGNARGGRNSSSSQVLGSPGRRGNRYHQIEIPYEGVTQDNIP